MLNSNRSILRQISKSEMEDSTILSPSKFSQTQQPPPQAASLNFLKSLNSNSFPSSLNTTLSPVVMPKWSSSSLKASPPANTLPPPPPPKNANIITDEHFSRHLDTVTDDEHGIVEEHEELNDAKLAKLISGLTTKTSGSTSTSGNAAAAAAYEEDDEEEYNGGVNLDDVPKNYQDEDVVSDKEPVLLKLANQNKASQNKAKTSAAATQENLPFNSILQASGLKTSILSNM